MAPTVAAGEPATLAAGTTWTWTQSWTDFPPGDGWSVTYYATGATSFVVTTTPRTTDYLALLAATDNGLIQAGTYQWEARATLSTETYVAGRGTWTVTATAVVAPDTDGRSFEEVMLARIQAEIQARVLGVGSAHESYANGDQSITKVPLAELQKMLTLYSMAVARQQHGGRLPAYEAVFVRP